MQQRKGILTFLLIVSIPVIFMIPQLANYPLTVISGLCVAAMGVQYLPRDETVYDAVNRLQERNKAKAVSCPAGA